MGDEKFFGIQEVNRASIPDAKRSSGFLATQEPYEYMNQAILELKTDHIIGNATQLANNQCTLVYNSSDQTLRDVNNSIVTPTDGDKIYIIGLDTLTDDLDLSAYDRLRIIGDKSLTIPNGTYSILLGDEVFIDLKVADSSKVTTGVNNYGFINYASISRTVSAVEFESKDLIINVTGNDTVFASFTRLSLLDSSYVPKFLNNKSYTWDITAIGVLEPGTSEKNSTDYGMWVDSDENLVLAPDLTGTTDSTVAGSLADSTATLLTDLVRAGDIVYNLTDKTQTTVAADATVEGQVTLTDDIFTSGENYKIVKMSPEGLGANRERIGTAYNNSSGNFYDSWYTQIQEEKTYNGDGTDFTLTSSPAIVTLRRAIATVRQVNDWTGKGSWFVSPKFTYNVASGSRTGATATMTGVTFKNISSLTQSCSGYGNSSSAFVYTVFAVLNTGNITISHAAATTTLYDASGEFECENKPTFHL